ncbi:MAG: PQQ-binding-like beta-propeller repeat protein [Opitutales bacterium]|nr:PQQ-binding-like beta-propeller repeat protein [Opitutales bacterium]
MNSSPLYLVFILTAFASLAQAVPPNHTFLGGEPFTRYELTLTEALPGGRDLTLHFGYQGGEIRQEWATVPGGDLVAERVDASALGAEDGRLTGEVDVWIHVDGVMYRGVYDLDFALGESVIEEAYTGHYAVRTSRRVYSTDELLVTPDQVRLFTYGDFVENTLSGRYEAPADDARPTAFTLHSGHLLVGSLSITRYITLSFEIDAGEVANVRVDHGRDSPSFTWSAEILEHDIAYIGDEVSGTVVMEITGGGPRTQDGIYTVSFEGVVSNNEVTGSFSSLLNGSPSQSSFLAGTATGLYEPENDRIYILDLKDGIESGLTLRLNLLYRDGAFVEGVALRPDVTHRFDVDVDGINVSAGGLDGTLRVYFPGGAIVAADHPFEVDYTLAANAEGAELAGSFSCIFGPVHPVGGSLSGQARDGLDLRTAYALDEALDWPAWNGPESNMAALRGGNYSLVENLHDARLLWRSEHVPPGRAQTTRYGESNISRYIERGGAAGGGSSPVVAHGMVFQYFFRPYGEELVGYPASEMADGNRTLGVEMWTVEAEDVVLAIDAATGATVWKTGVPGGRYHGWDGTGIAKGAYTAKAAAGYGRVYVHGSNNRTFGFNAHTGELLWTRSTGNRYAVALDGMAVFSGTHLRALDADTGATLWEIPNAGTDGASPLHWRHEGTSYIITGNGSGRVVCVKAETGAIQWELSGVGNNEYTMSVGEGHLLLNVGGLGGEPDRLGAYTITPQGAEFAWSLAGNYGHDARGGTIPVIKEGRVYFQSDGSTALMLDLASGEILATAGNNWNNGFTQWFDDRLIIQNDATHSDTPLNLFLADGASFSRLAPEWRPAFRDTSSYTPVLTSHAYSDGRLFIRGARGIYALDLRIPSEGEGPPVLEARAPAEISHDSAVVRAFLRDGASEINVTLHYGTTDGGTDPAAWENSTNLGTHALGGMAHTLAGLEDETTYFYRFRAENTEGVVWTAASGELTSGVVPPPDPPVILQGPEDKDAFFTGHAQFTVIAEGGEPMEYQWRHNGTALTDGTRVAGARSSVLVLSDLTPADAGEYDVVISNADGTVSSVAAVLALSEAVPPEIVQAPQGGSFEAGLTIELSVAAEGSAPFEFQWRRNGQALSDGGAVSGANSATLTINGVGLSHEGDYDVIVTNLVGQVVSGSARVLVFVLPPIDAVLAEWNFNHFESSDTTNGFGETIDADVGTGTLFVQSATTTGTNFRRDTGGGTDLNASADTPAGGSIELRRGERWNNGYLEFRFDMTGHEAAVLSFAYRTGGSLPSTATVEWSADGGGSYTEHSVLTNADYGSFTVVELDFSEIDDLNDVAEARVRLRYNADGGAASSGLSAAIDNVRVEARRSTSGYDEWRTARFGDIDDPAGAPGFDPLGRGIVNALEYALGLDHLVALRDGLPRALNGWEMRFTRRADLDLLLVIEATDELGAPFWDIIAVLEPGSAEWTGPAPVTEVPQGETHEVTVTHPSGPPARGERRFMRLRLQTP